MEVNFFSSIEQLLWLMVFMIRHPEVKQQVQNEIDNIVGRSRW